MTELQYSQNLLLVMDSLWFNQIILFSEPASKPTPTPQFSSQSSLDFQSDLTSTPLLEEQSSFSSDTPPTSSKDGSLGFNSDEEDDNEDEEPACKYRRKRPAMLSLASIQNRSRSSSPSAHKLPKHLRSSANSVTSLRKAMSCRNLDDLEYAEVKGFMDLGFKFKKEKLSPRMMSVLPGLQRLDEFKDEIKGQSFNATDNLNGQESKRPTPYLSEAWLIRRPDSPLLNWKMPRVSTSNDMKKHLKSWARTVATAIELEY